MLTIILYSSSFPQPSGAQALRGERRQQCGCLVKYHKTEVVAWKARVGESQIVLSKNPEGRGSLRKLEHPFLRLLICALGWSYLLPQCALLPESGR